MVEWRWVLSVRFVINGMCMADTWQTCSHTGEIWSAIEIQIPSPPPPPILVK